LLVGVVILIVLLGIAFAAPALAAPDEKLRAAAAPLIARLNLAETG